MSKNKYFQCIDANSTSKGSILLTPNNRIAKKVEHACTDIDTMEEVHEHEEISSRKFKINGHSYYFCTEQDTGNKYFQCICSNSIGEKCPGFIKMTPNNRIVKKIDHTCSGNYTVDKPSEDNGLEVQEYEERGNRFKINGHDYRFCKVLKTKNKHFRCVHRYSRTKKKCQGSITITPNFQIVTKVEHICIDLLEIDKVQEYEEIGRKFKINGYCYYFRDENTKNHIAFRCAHRYSTKNRCQGSITITPNLQIVKKVEHICNGFGTEDKPLEDKDLEKVQEYEEIGKNFKINGHRYYLTYKHKTGNKYFQCILVNSTKNRCHGSITITPNLHIAKKVEHNCIDLLEMEKVLEYEEIGRKGRKFKINGYCYYFRDENTKKNHKTFRCIFSTKKCRAFVTITPNLQIVKKVDHNCDQVCEITPQQNSKTTEKEVSSTLSVSWL